MDIQCNSDIYKNQILDVADIFYAAFKSYLTEDPRYKIIVTPDLKKDLYLYSSEREKKHFDKNGITDFNGYLVQPLSEELFFIILIAERMFADTQYVHTLVHELVHLHDYFQYYRDNGNLYIQNEEEQKKKYFREFYYWSEYHAKNIGTGINALYQLHIVYDTPIPEDGKYVVAVCFQTEPLLRSLDAFQREVNPETKSHSFYSFLYELMGYYGRLSVYRSDNPEDFSDPNFPKERLIKTFGQAVLDIYQLLLKTNSYETAVNNLSTFNMLLNRILTKINAGISTWSFFDESFKHQLSQVSKQLNDIAQAFSQLQYLKIPNLNSFLPKDFQNSDSKKPKKI